MTYALGRGVDYNDQPEIRAIVAARRGRPLPFFGSGSGHRGEPPFRMKIKTAPDAAVRP